MVNDCAYVGETLVKYLPSDVTTSYLKRSRGLWDKTFGLAWKILRANGDVFHVHYLLQDCYLAAKFGKRPLVGHAHGSDLRNGLKHRVWGRIVRYNLENCDKIFVSTPDLLRIAKEYRNDVEYLPNPVDTHLFYPNPKPPRRYEKKLRVLVASGSDWVVKGTDIAIHALSELKEEVEVSVVRYGRDFVETLALAKSLGLTLNILPKMPHEKVREYYWDSDVVIDQFKVGTLGMITLEAIACGRPVITYLSSEHTEYSDFSLMNVNSVGKVVEALRNVSPQLWEAEYQYLNKRHNPEKVAERVHDVYKALTQ